MLQSKATKNVAAAWASLLTHLVVGVFLSPYILHRLGNEAFGVWVLIFSVTGYYGLLDLGVRQGVVRYVARYSANGDGEQLNRFVNTSVFVYSIIALATLLATVVCAWYLPVWFKIPAHLRHAAQIVLLIAGTGAALTFPLSVLAGILSGLQDFVHPHSAQIGVSLLRAVLVLTVLHGGGGLVGLAFVTVGLGLAGHAVLLLFLPSSLRLRWSWSFVDSQTWRAMIGYSSVAFLIVVADKLRFQSDPIVIGSCLSAGAITSFAVGAKLVDYATAVVQALSQIFTPMSSHFEATGDVQKLRTVFVKGNRACALVIFPISLTLLILGKPLVTAWVGANYVASYPLLIVLLLPRTLYLAQACSVKILLGVAKHRRLAGVLLMEGTANLFLSLILARPLGVMGVALGTAVPLLVTSLLFLPRHLCQLLEVPLRTYLREAYLVPLGLCLLPSVFLYACRYFLPAYSLHGLCLNVAGAAAVYVAGLAWWLGMNGTIDLVRHPAHGQAVSNL